MTERHDNEPEGGIQKSKKGSKSPQKNKKPAKTDGVQIGKQGFGTTDVEGLVKKFEDKDNQNQKQPKSKEKKSSTLSKETKSISSSDPEIREIIEKAGNSLVVKDEISLIEKTKTIEAFKNFSEAYNSILWGEVQKKKNVNLNFANRKFKHGIDLYRHYKNIKNTFTHAKNAAEDTPGIVITNTIKEIVRGSEVIDEVAKQLEELHTKHSDLFLPEKKPEPIPDPIAIFKKLVSDIDRKIIDAKTLDEVKEILQNANSTISVLEEDNPSEKEKIKENYQKMIEPIELVISRKSSPEAIIRTSVRNAIKRLLPPTEDKTLSITTAQSLIETSPTLTVEEIKNKKIEVDRKITEMFLKAESVEALYQKLEDEKSNLEANAEINIFKINLIEGVQSYINDVKEGKKQRVYKKRGTTKKLFAQKVFSSDGTEIYLYQLLDNLIAKEKIDLTKQNTKETQVEEPQPLTTIESNDTLEQPITTPEAVTEESIQSSLTSETETPVDIIIPPITESTPEPISSEPSTSIETSIEEREIWEKELAESKQLLEENRKKYIETLISEKEAEKNKSKPLKWLRRATLGILEDLGAKEKPVSPAMVDAKLEYDKSKKQFGNALANIHWTEVKNRRKPIDGDVKYDSIEYKRVQAQISKDLLEQVAIPEYEATKDLGIDQPSVKDKNIFTKISNILRDPKTKTARYILTGLVVTGTAAVAGIGAPAAAIIGGWAVLARIGGAGLATYGAKKFFELSNKKIESQKQKKQENLKSNYSVITGVNAYSEAEAQAGIQRARAVLNSAGVAVLISLATRASTTDSINELTNILSTPSIDSIPSVPTNPVIPENITPPSIPEETTEPLGPYMPLGPELPPESNIETPSIPTASPSTTPLETVGSNSLKIEDEIKDYRVGGKLIHDSGELSLRKTLERNAEKFGYKESVKISKSKWAEIQTDKYLKSHPEIRNAITHDGNKIVIEKNLDGSFKAHIEKGIGRNFVVEEPPKAHIKEALDHKEIKTTDFKPDFKEIHEPKIFDGKTITEDMKVGNIGAKELQDIVDLEYHRQYKAFIPLKVTSPEWKKLSLLKAEDLLRSKNNIPEFVRSHDIASPRLNWLGRSSFAPSLKAVSNLKQILVMGTERYGISLHPKESIGSYFERFNREITLSELRMGNAATKAHYLKLLKK